MLDSAVGNGSIASRLVVHARDYAARCSIRIKLLISLVLVVAVMTAGTLFAVRQTLLFRTERHVRLEAHDALQTFQTITLQQRSVLSRKAELLAMLAAMRDGDPSSIMDASQDPWQSDEADLFAIVDASGKISSLQSRSPQLPASLANQAVGNILKSPLNQNWWVNGGRVYQIVVMPFYQDAPSNRVLLGKVIAGRELNQPRVEQLSKILSSQILFQNNSQTLVSSFSPFDERDAVAQLDAGKSPQEIELGTKRFFASSMPLNSGLRVVVLRSDEDALASLSRLNGILLGVGILAILLGATLFYFLSAAFARPLQSLAEGVQALERGDFSYPLAPVGQDEVARVTRAFDRMRNTLQKNEAQRQALEDQLRQSQKMDALGRLAGGVAHDFNNLLTVIKGNADIAVDRVPSSDPVRANCEQIGKVADRAAALTRQLLAFSRRQLLQPKVLDVNDLIMDASRLLKRLLREDIEFNLHLGESLAHVVADPGQLEQVLLNLTVNASDAMPNGGTLVIETHNVTVDDRYAASHSGGRPGDYVLLAVSDSGHGMDAETKARIFEPFFTTKEPGKGTGLGLATVYGIVNQSSGFIHVDSALGSGTRFEIYLPQSSSRLEPTLAAVNSSALPSGKATVLLAEDDPDVRALTCEFLQSAGYKVLTACDGVEALEAGERMRGAIHVLLTDVVMPRLRAPELAERLRELIPNLQVIFISGYSEELHASGGLPESSTFLQKPFTRDQLLHTLADLLRQGSLPSKLPLRSSRNSALVRT